MLLYTYASIIQTYSSFLSQITYTTPALVRAMHGDTSGLDVETINAIDDAKETYFEEPEVKVDQEVYTTEDEENYNKEMEENVKLVVKHLSQCLDDGLYSFQTA